LVLFSVLLTACRSAPVSLRLMRFPTLTPGSNGERTPVSLQPSAATTNAVTDATQSLATAVVSTPSGFPLGTTEAAVDQAPDEIGRVFVPAGPFLMGAADDDIDSTPNERPIHTVVLLAYWIDRTEVTNVAYRRCVEAGTCQPPERASWFNDPDMTENPVVWISWSDAAAYCHWVDGRLPSEAEWEKAARGVDGRRFPWGASLPEGDRLNFADANLDEPWAERGVDDGYEYSASVGSYPSVASPFGALDMAGNVWEWVADWYDERYYLAQPSTDPHGPDASPTNTRGVRGGSFLSTRRNVRAAFRFGYSPNTVAADLGFRCAWDDGIG
jgi:serine/threonine-protein kinase